jgi:uncharacterized protein
MKQLIWIDIIALALVIIGALNWGLVGLFDFNLVSTLFASAGLQKLIYIIVGIAGVYGVFWEISKVSNKEL